MRLVIGGAYQGKLTWTMHEYDIPPAEVCDLAREDPRPGCSCYTHLETLTKRDEAPERWLPLLENSVVISREIGCGVVPMETFERQWRERHGTFLQQLARKAERVTRVFCGLTEELK